MVVAGAIYRAADHGRREVVALCSCRLDGNGTATLRPGVGLLGVFSVEPRILGARGILRIALRRWSGCGMKINIGKLSLLVAAFSLAAQACRAAEPLAQAHAHNDYEHARPLLDALEHGFCSVEADVHLAHGALLVAHDAEKVDPKRTLESLYLEPLRARVKKNAGRVHSNGPPFLLMIDIKTEAETTYAALLPVLQRYRDMLTQFTPNETRTGAVTIVLSGNRPTQTVTAQPLRYAAIDGRLPDLDAKPSRHLVPLVSDNWAKHFLWRGEGEITGDERQKLKLLVETAHRQGRKIRFWAVPDAPAGWKVMREAGVDLINTDNLKGLQEFLSAR